jgi:hypothetical protein
MSNPCFCGCGRETARTFVTGHDTRFVFAVLREVFREEEATLGEALAKHFPRQTEIVQRDNAWIAAQDRERERDCRSVGHEWPAELEHDARCERCGLKYGEWSE